MNKSKFTDFKKQFQSWCGFELESTLEENILEEIKNRQWDLENEINQQAKAMKRTVEEIFNKR